MDSKGKIRKPKLKTPYCPSNESKGNFSLNTFEEKLVADYLNISLFEVYEMQIFEYWFIARDSVIYYYKQTEEGEKYLEKCWIMEQTKPDRTSLRKKFGKGEHNG